MAPSSKAIMAPSSKASAAPAKRGYEFFGP